MNLKLFNKGNYKLSIFILVILGFMFSMFVIAEDNVAFINETNEIQENISKNNFSEEISLQLGVDHIEENISVERTLEENPNHTQINENRDKLYCKENSDCVWAIRDDNCCSCPYIESIAKLQQDNHIVPFGGYKKNNVKDTYPALSKLDCSAARCNKACLPISPLKCAKNKCQRDYNFRVYQINS